MMTIKQIDNGVRGKFIAFVDGVQAGLIAYTATDVGHISLMHTEIEDDFRGQDIGKQLLLEIVEYARESNIIITPVCPFTVAMFQRLPEIRDVLEGQ